MRTLKSDCLQIWVERALHAWKSWPKMNHPWSPLIATETVVIFFEVSVKAIDRRGFQRSPEFPANRNNQKSVLNSGVFGCLLLLKLKREDSICSGKRGWLFALSRARRMCAIYRVLLERVKQVPPSLKTGVFRLLIQKYRVLSLSTRNSLVLP